MSDNPLMQFARHPELTVKLASPKSWYPEGFIQYTLNDEVEIYPMLPKDELMLYNPDALISGQAMITLIKSCCPAVLDPSKLYYPDANIILLGIKRATYGEEHKQTHRCPKCDEQVKKLIKEDPEKLTQLIKEGKITDHTEEHKFNIDELLYNVKTCEEEFTVEEENLIFYIQPITIAAKEKFSLISMKRNKLLRMYADMLSRDEDISSDEKNDLIQTISVIQSDMIDSNNDITAQSIKCVRLPDGSYINDFNKIKEFINNAKVQFIDKINNKIKEVNNIGLPSELNITCSFCGNEWKVPFEGFNQSDFFV